MQGSNGDMGGQAAPDLQRPAPRLGGRSRPLKNPTVILVVLTVVYLFNFIDRQIIAILAQPIKTDLGLTDTELGLTTGFAFALFYTVLGLPIAHLIDRKDRIRIVAICCFFWSLFTAICGQARTFAELALARMMVGVGEAGCAPAAYSILSDSFPEKRRPLVLALFTLGVPLGIVVGAGAGSAIAAAHGWRFAFLALALPGIALALFLYLFVAEPPRGRYQSAAMARMEEETTSFRSCVLLFLRTPSLLLMSIGGGLASFCGYCSLNWLPSFLIRVQGMNLHQVSAYYGIVAGGAMAIGLLLGGWLTSTIGSVRGWIYGAMPGLAALLSVPLLAACYLAADWRTSLLFAFVPGVLSMIHSAPTIAFVQNSVPANARATAASILLLLLNLIGGGGGPLFIGLVSDAIAADHGSGALRIAMLASLPFFVLTALVYAAAAVAIRREAGRRTDR